MSAASFPTPTDLIDASALIEREFTHYDPNYQKNKMERQKRLKGLARMLFSFEEQGRNMACSQQIFIEAKWLIGYTADWPRVDRRLKDLAESLTEKDQAFATKQSPKDGGWGACYEEWFMKLEATVDALERLADRRASPHYSIALLSPINQPDTLVAYLRRLLVSDIAAKGVDQRSELGSVTASLSTILFKRHVAQYVRKLVRGFAFGDGTVAAYQGFINRWQDPASGYWGAWYQSNNVIYRAPDLSLTYHQIAYHPDGISFWSEIIETTFAMRARPYPYGWLARGHYNNHNNYDVARILRIAWPYASKSQKRAAQNAIGEMLDWCLNDSLKSDGSFKQDQGFYNSTGAGYYFGVSFLDEIGFWKKSERFWTDSAFTNGQKICCTIKSRIRELGLKSNIAAAAMEKLDQSCPAC